MVDIWYIHKSCVKYSFERCVSYLRAYDQSKTTEEKKKKDVGLIIIPHNKHNITISREEMHRQVNIIMVLRPSVVVRV